MKKVNITVVFTVEVPEETITENLIILTDEVTISSIDENGNSTGDVIVGGDDVFYETVSCEEIETP